jgi:hypothetical protein
MTRILDYSLRCEAISITLPGCGAQRMHEFFTRDRHAVELVSAHVPNAEQNHDASGLNPKKTTGPALLAGEG